MKPTNPSAFDPVLAWLDAGAPHIQVPGDGELAGFHMSVVVNNINEHEQRCFIQDIEECYLAGMGRVPPCGTVCCIGGALIQWHNPVNVSEIEWRDSWFQRAMSIAGMKEDDAMLMFLPRQRWRLVITPAWAAACIRNYIETGVVDWRATRPVGTAEELFLP